MFAPRPPGTWSSHPSACRPHQFLIPGRRYRVIQPFTDYDKVLHPLLEEWTFIGSNFVPYEDGMSFFVSVDGSQEWQIRLQWRPEQQAEILDHLAKYLHPL